MLQFCFARPGPIVSLALHLRSISKWRRRWWWCSTRICVWFVFILSRVINSIGLKRHTFHCIEMEWNRWTMDGWRSMGHGTIKNKMNHHTISRFVGEWMFKKYFDSVISNQRDCFCSVRCRDTGWSLPGADDDGVRCVSSCVTRANIINSFSRKCDGRSTCISSGQRYQV